MSNRRHYQTADSNLSRRISTSDLTNEELILRTKDYGRDNLKILYGIVKAIGLTTASFVLLNLIAVEVMRDSSIATKMQIENVSLDFLLRVILWVASCMVLILTYDACLFGSLFLYRPVNGAIIMLIFSYIGFEFFLFAILYPKFFLSNIEIPNLDNLQNKLAPYTFKCWITIYCLYTLSIGLFAFYAVRSINCTKYGIAGLKEKLQKHFKTDVIETFIFGILGISCIFFELGIHGEIIIGSVITVLSFYFYFRQYERRKIITQHLFRSQKKPSVFRTILFILRIKKEL